MKRTQATLLTLYSDISAYAAAKLKDFGLDPSEADDLVGEAYLRAQAKLPRHSPHRGRNALLKSIAWSETMGALRRRGKIAALVDQQMVRLDQTAPVNGSNDGDDEGLETENVLLSDRGSAADRTNFDDPPEPEWVYLFRVERAKLRHKPRQIVNAYGKLWAHEEVRLKCKLSRRAFCSIRKKLLARFDQCFQVYHAHLAEKSCAAM